MKKKKKKIKAKYLSSEGDGQNSGFRSERLQPLPRTTYYAQNTGVISTTRPKLEQTHKASRSHGHTNRDSLPYQSI